jgi:hypothetical protein
MSTRVAVVELPTSSERRLVAVEGAHQQGVMAAESHYHHGAAGPFERESFETPECEVGLLKLPRKLELTVEVLSIFRCLRQ